VRPTPVVATPPHAAVTPTRAVVTLLLTELLLGAVAIPPLAAATVIVPATCIPALATVSAPAITFRENQLSMELYIIPISTANHEDAYIVYRPLLGLAFVGNQAMTTLVKSLAEDISRPVREDIRTFLEKTGFYNPDPPQPQSPESGQFSPTNVALLLTNQCQLRCTYCYAAAGEFPPQHLPLDIGYKAIDYTYENLKRLHYPKLAVSLHGGGEPTFPWKTMKKLVAYAKEKPIPTEFSLTSNGIWSEQQTKWIMAYISSVGISMDGSPQTQDMQRPMTSGKGSSRVVMRTLHDMEANNFSFGLRLTAVPPFDRLIEDIRYLCENTHCKRMQVEAAFNTRRGEEGLPDQETGQKFLQVFFAAQRLAEGYERLLRCAGSDVDQVTTSSCSSPFNTLVVTPQGRLVACFEVLNDSHPLAGLATIGQITSEGVFVDEDARASLKKKIDERRASCRDCFCYWSCAGDCLIRVFSPNPENFLQHGVRCELNQALIREMLLKRIAAGNGVWKRTPMRQT
jgi:uncharacterized protein